MQDSQTTIHTDARHRMGQRPLALAVNTGEGLGFQDIGSSFGRAGGPSGLQKPVKTYQSRLKRSAHRTVSASESPHSSDDEIRLCSSPSRRKPAGTTTTCDAEQTAPVNAHGRIRLFPSHPDYKQDDVIQRLKFVKKNKPVLDAITVDEDPPPSSVPSNSPDQSQDIFKPISHDILREDMASTAAKPYSPSVPTRGLSRLQKSPSPVRPSAHLTAENKKVPQSTPLSRSLSTQAEEAAPPLKSRPRPRVIHKPGKQLASPDSTPQPSMTSSDSTRRAEFPFQAKSPSPSENNTRTTVRPRPRPQVKQALGSTESMRRVPQEFPMSFSAKENVSDGGTSDHGRTRIKNKGKGRARLQPESTFPTLSPLKSPSEGKILKGKGRTLPDEEQRDENGTLAPTRASKQPFPMSAQLLESINRCSPPPKRVSDDSDAGHGRASKKLKDTISG